MAALSLSPEPRHEAPEPAVAVIASPATDPDAADVARAQAGDGAAFGRLFARHHGRIYAMCRRLLRDHAEVEDAVQHAFLEAWRCLPRFEGRSKFTTWLTRIAIHTCLGFRRRVKRLLFSADPVDQTSAPPVWAQPPMSPDDDAAHQARRRATDEVLLQLSDKKRVVFVLAEFDGMTAPEIAEIVGAPEATVRTRLFHARRDFAKRVRQHPGFADLFTPEAPDAGGDDAGGAR